MLKVSLIDLLFRGVPEALILMWGIYLLNFKKMNVKLYLFSSLLYVFSVYLVRILPIDYGVHTMIGIIIIIFIATFINKITIIKAISSTLILVISLSICECLNVLILDNLLQFNIKQSLSIPIKRNLYTSPSLILFISIIALFNKYIDNRKE